MNHVTRRTVLKGISAVVATAALNGCSSGSSSDSSNVLDYNVDLKFEQAERFAFNTGPFNCGGKCVHKFHIKNGRIFAMTSAGDIPQVAANETDASNQDEWDGCEEIDKPMQYRSCVRGYSYIHRIYQPDRLKYPLLQTGNKGELANFKRITWEKAYELIADAFVKAYQRYDATAAWNDASGKRPYLPIMDRIGTSNSLAQELNYVYVRNCSNASNGNSEAAKLDSVGGAAFRNSKSDNLNAGFILIWGSDPTRNSNHENGSYWPMLKAKEAGKPMVTISPVCTDNAATYSTQVVATIPADSTLNASPTQVKIPGWVPIRPGTDGALLTAMMYVLYRRKLYDTDYIGTGAGDTKQPSAGRKCFGFWEGDSTMSMAPAGSMGGFPKTFGLYTQGADFAGTTFTVPANESFEAYLLSLEALVAPGGWVPGRGGWMSNTPSASAGMANVSATGSFEGDPADYYDVLAYASKVTGVSTDIIEALACHYANNGTGLPSKIDRLRPTASVWRRGICMAHHQPYGYVWLH